LPRWIVGTYPGVWRVNSPWRSIIAVGNPDGPDAGAGPDAGLSGTMARGAMSKGALTGLDAIVARTARTRRGRATYLRREPVEGQFALRDVMFRYEDDGAPTVDIKADTDPAGAAKCCRARATDRANRRC